MACALFAFLVYFCVVQAYSCNDLVFVVGCVRRRCYRQCSLAISSSHITVGLLG